jgi:hypothetical protein
MYVFYINNFFQYLINESDKCVTQISKINILQYLVMQDPGTPDTVTILPPDILQYMVLQDPGTPDADTILSPQCTNARPSHLFH